MTDELIKAGTTVQEGFWHIIDHNISELMCLYCLSRNGLALSDSSIPVMILFLVLWYFWIFVSMNKVFDDALV